MASQPYLVVRLIPKDPIDGATFTTYLDGLQLQVFDAYSGLPLSDIAYSSPLSFFQWPLGYSGSSEPFFASGSAVTTQGTPYNGSDYGTVLNFSSNAGMSVGSYVFTTDGTSSSGPTIDPSGNYQVVAVTATTATLNKTLSNYVPPGTVVSFIGNAFTDNATSPSPNAGQFALPTTGAAQTGDGQPVSQTDPYIVLPFASTTGVTVGMLVTGTDIVANATVAEVQPTSVTLSAGGTVSPPTGTQITFTLNAPFASLTLTPTGSTTGSDQLTFSSTAGIAFGMTVNPISGYVPPGTTVTAVTSTTVTLSQALIAALPSGQSVTFTFPLSSGIVQHLTESVTIILVRRPERSHHPHRRRDGGHSAQSAGASTGLSQPHGDGRPPERQDFDQYDVLQCAGPVQPDAGPWPLSVDPGQRDQFLPGLAAGAGHGADRARHPERRHAAAVRRAIPGGRSGAVIRPDQRPDTGDPAGAGDAEHQRGDRHRFHAELRDNNGDRPRHVRQRHKHRARQHGDHRHQPERDAGQARAGHRCHQRRGHHLHTGRVAGRRPGRLHRILHARRLRHRLELPEHAADSAGPAGIALHQPAQSGKQQSNT